MQEYWGRACEVVRERFGERLVYAMATQTEQGVNIRSVHSFMYNDKMYVVTHNTSNKVTEIKRNPHVAMVYNAQKLYGTARDIGHPLLDANDELRKVLRREFADVYTDMVNEADPTVCILEISVNRAVAYTQLHKYDIDFEHETLLRQRHYGMYYDY